MQIEVWMLVYEHKYGMDLSGHASELEANRTAAELAAREAPRECTAEIALQVQGFYSLGAYAEAITLYTEHVDSETFEVRQVFVEGDVMRGSTVVENGNGVVHMVKAFPALNQPGDSWCGRMFFWVSANVALPVNTSGFKAFLPEEPRIPSCLSCLGTAHGE